MLGGSLIELAHSLSLFLDELLHEPKHYQQDILKALKLEDKLFAAYENHEVG